VQELLKTFMKNRSCKNTTISIAVVCFLGIVFSKPNLWSFSVLCSDYLCSSRESFHSVLSVGERVMPRFWLSILLNWLFLWVNLS
jgi:hypothetical protein